MMNADRETLNFDHFEAQAQKSSITFKDRLIVRTRYLYDAIAEDYEGQKPSFRSFSAMVGALEQFPGLTYPDLTLTPDGDFYAEWRRLPGRKLSVEFLDRGIARCIVLFQNVRHPERTDHIVVVTTTDALGDVLAPLGLIADLAA